MDKRLQRRPAKRAVRSFKLAIDFRAGGRPFQKWAEEVVESLESKTVRVFSPVDKSALDEISTEDGSADFGARTSCEVSIREWLPVGCQAMGWNDCFGSDKPPKEKGVLGRYWHNAHEVLFPKVGTGYFRPPGPAGFQGRIILYKDALMEAEDAFKWMLAHELVHCFDTLAFLVPAVQNWRRFWIDVLESGDACERARGQFCNTAQFLDNYGNYGSTSELDVAKHYWPSDAERWFRSAHPQGTRPTLFSDETNIDAKKNR